MKSSTKKIMGILTISIIFMILLSILDPFKIKEYGYIVIISISLILSIIMLGYAKARNSNIDNIAMSTAIFSLLYQTLIFVIFGFMFGFLASGYKLGINHLLKIGLPTLLIITLSEILRYQFIEKGRSSKLIIILTTIFFIIVDFFINYSIYSLTTFKGIFELCSFVIFPSIMKNIYLTYSSYHYGYKPNILYRIFMEMTSLYLPLIPDVGDYLNCVLSIIFPFIMIIYLISYTENTTLNPKRKKTTEKITRGQRTAYTIISTLVLLYVVFMSGMFKYYLLAVGSGSMEPEISVGDMVFVEKTNDYDNLKIGDILVYEKENKVILHRIIKIRNDNGHNVYKTKGDNNEIEDMWEVQESEVIGKVHFKIMKIGYPTIWLNRMFEGGK